MKRKTLRFIMAAALIFSSLPVALPVAAAEDFTISTAAELEAFRDSVNAGNDYSGSTVTLTADIDLGGSEEHQWTPIGSETAPFSGTFDGSGHEITGLYIEQTDGTCLGLFGLNVGTIQNLSTDGYINGEASAGGIAAQNTGTIVNCSYRGELFCEHDSGGIVGINDGTVTACCNLGHIYSDFNTGGIIGMNNGAVNGCCNMGDIDGIYDCGGIVGENTGTISGCYNTGAVEGVNSNVRHAIGSTVGGILGRNLGTVENCYNTGGIHYGMYIGGIVGTNGSYVPGSFTQTTPGTINNCYNTGIVTVTNQTPCGIVGDNISGSVTGCYYLAGINLERTVSYYSSLRTEAFIDADDADSAAIDHAAFSDLFTFSGWDFSDTWVMSKSLGRPVLRILPEAGSRIPDGPFTDVYSGEWYASAVQFVHDRGLMTGVSETEFAPEADVTRAMFVTVLYRLENRPDLSNEILGYPFADVDAQSWYGNAVYWARQNGIVAGVSDESFAPEENITREQMAAILYRYAKYKAYDTAANGNLNYTDSSAISDYAAEATVWAADKGILQGNEDGTFAPAANATRAQTAAVFQRIVQQLQ